MVKENKTYIWSNGKATVLKSHAFKKAESGDPYLPGLSYPKNP